MSAGAAGFRSRRRRPARRRPAPLGVATIVRRLRKEHGPVETPRRLDPLSELVFTILSQHTSDRNTYPAFQSFRRRFSTWDAARRAPVRSIAASVRSAGLADQKAPRIKRVLQEIHEQHGVTSLDVLNDIPTEEAARYLGSFHGVGPKTVACVLLFACGRPVLPVDTHVYRVSKRLGLLAANDTAEKAHEVLGRLVPDRLVLDFHMLQLRHGRKVCRAQNPRCAECVLVDGCPEGRRRTTASDALSR